MKVFTNATEITNQILDDHMKLIDELSLAEDGSIQTATIDKLRTDTIKMKKCFLVMADEIDDWAERSRRRIKMGKYSLDVNLTNGIFDNHIELIRNIIREKDEDTRQQLLKGLLNDSIQMKAHFISLSSRNNL